MNESNKNILNSIREKIGKKCDLDKKNYRKNIKLKFVKDDKNKIEKYQIQDKRIQIKFRNLGKKINETMINNAIFT